MTSSPSIADLKGNISGRTIYPPSLIIVASIVANLWRVEQGADSVRKDEKTKKKKKKPGLGRVNEIRNHVNGKSKREVRANFLEITGTQMRTS